VTGTVIFDPNVYLITKLPAQMNPYETGAIVITSFLLAVIATLYPSWRASRLDPVEALRYE
jgi:lipoprotein-releasing system permease protein